MSGTPFISESYSILGSRAPEGTTSRFELRVSLVVLGRGPALFRPSVLTEFHSLGFPEILCIEQESPRFDAEKLLGDLPGLRFLVLSEPATPGVRINLAAREIRGDRFLVLWDDQSLSETGLHSKVQRLWQDFSFLVMVPEMRDREGYELPCVQVPTLEKDRLKILTLGTDQENVDTLFASDYTGLYNRGKFLATGGYDQALGNPFWQKVDWGVRSHLWGERLVVDRGFKVDYRSEVPSEDQTPDRSYSRFYLRNLAVRHLGDHGVLPMIRFWAHARRSGRSFSDSLAEFLNERAWVKTHRYRFQTDARLLSELWGNL